MAWALGVSLSRSFRRGPTPVFGKLLKPMDAESGCIVCKVFLEVLGGIQGILDVDFFSLELCSLLEQMEDKLVS